MVFSSDSHPSSSFTSSPQVGRIKSPFVSLGHTSSNDAPSFFSETSPTSKTSARHVPGSPVVKHTQEQVLDFPNAIAHPSVVRPSVQPLEQSYYHIPVHQAGLWASTAWPLSLQWRMAWAHQRDLLEHPNRDPWKYQEQTLYESLQKSAMAWHLEDVHFPHTPNELIEVAKPVDAHASKAVVQAALASASIEVIFQYLPHHDADRFTKGKTHIIASRLQHTHPSMPPQVLLEKVQVHILMQSIRTPKQLELVLMHELGHALGLWGHSALPHHVMWHELGTCQTQCVTETDRHRLALVYQWHLPPQGTMLPQAQEMPQVSQGLSQQTLDKMKEKLTQGKLASAPSSSKPVPSSGRLSKSW
ncbi:MAG: matrixin family metalloprotease [Vampirovibrionales bacterium]